MANDWKIQLCLYGCDCLYDDMVQKDYGVTVELPSVPSIGDVVWTDKDTCDRLNRKAKECWDRNHCKDCPYSWGGVDSIENIYTEEHRFVVAKIFDMTLKIVNIGLFNRPTAEE